MALKGLNRKTFEQTVMKTMRRRLADLGKFSVYDAQSTIYIEPKSDDIDIDEAFSRMQKVFGIATLSARRYAQDFDEICRVAVEYLGADLQQVHTFKVVAKRSDKTFPMDSMQLAY